MCASSEFAQIFFGMTSKKKQNTAMKISPLSNRDVQVVLPTGVGKSLIFQDFAVALAKELLNMKNSNVKASFNTRSDR